MHSDDFVLDVSAFGGASVGGSPGSGTDGLLLGLELVLDRLHLGLNSRVLVPLRSDLVVNSLDGSFDLLPLVDLLALDGLHLGLRGPVPLALYDDLGLNSIKLTGHGLLHGVDFCLHSFGDPGVSLVALRLQLCSEGLDLSPEGPTLILAGFLFRSLLR